MALGSLRVDIADGQPLARADCGADHRQMRRGTAGLRPGIGEKRVRFRPLLRGRGHGADLGRQHPRRPRQHRIVAFGHQPHPLAQRLHLARVQHQRRQGDRRTQDVAHPALPLDRQARGHQRGHVAPQRPG